MVIAINRISILVNAQLDPVFSERVVNLWNSLPADRISFASLSAFKNSLRTVDLLSLRLQHISYVTSGQLYYPYA